MSVFETLAMISDSNIISENLAIFMRAIEGAPVKMVTSKNSVKWRKLGLVYYSRSKQRYFLTEYSTKLLKRILGST